MAFAVRIPDENSFPGQLALMDGRPRIDVAQSSLELRWRGGATLNEPVDMCGEGGVVAGVRYQRWLALSLLHSDHYRPSVPANTVPCPKDHSHSARNRVFGSNASVGSSLAAVAVQEHGKHTRWSYSTWGTPPAGRTSRPARSSESRSGPGWADFREIRTEPAHVVIARLAADSRVRPHWVRETEADIHPRDVRVEGILALADRWHGEHRPVECRIELRPGEEQPLGELLGQRVDRLPMLLRESKRLLAARGDDRVDVLEISRPAVGRKMRKLVCQQPLVPCITAAPSSGVWPPECS
jgi:hypothetical protein